MDSQEKYYADHYEEITNSGAVGFVASLTHKTLENGRLLTNKPITKLVGPFSKVIEVGAGHGQHLQYVKHGFDSYIQTDLRSHLLPVDGLNEAVISIEQPIDATNLPYADSTFDRLVATCLLAHIPDVEAALNEWRRVVKPNGIISIYLACEPGFLLRLGQSLSTRIKQKNLGVNRYLVHYRDHRNMYVAMKVFIKETFPKGVKIKRFPFPILSWNFNLWAIATITNQK